VWIIASVAACPTPRLKYELRPSRNNIQDTFPIGTAGYNNTLRRNCLLQRVIEGKIKGVIEVIENEEDDVGSYWMTLRKGEDTVI
jgi:hypothetical protein